MYTYTNTQTIKLIIPNRSYDYLYNNVYVQRSIAEVWDLSIVQSIQYPIRKGHDLSR